MNIFHQPQSILETQRTMQTNPMSTQVGSFVRSPQGQQALLAFAQQALAQSQNPRTGTGAGLLGAIQSGLVGYKGAQQQAEQQKWTKEQQDMTRTQFEQQSGAAAQAEAAKERERAANREERAQEQHDKAMEAEGDVTLYGSDGSSVTVKASDAKQWIDRGMSIVKPGKSGRMPTNTVLSAIAAGVMPDNEWGLTPEQARAALKVYSDLLGSENVLKMLLGGTADTSGGENAGLAEILKELEGK